AGLPRPYTIRLVPACVLQIEAVDADSGRPIAKIEFEQETDGTPSGWAMVESATGFGTSPVRTDDDGKLRVAVKPGKRRITLMTGGYETVKGPTEAVELPAGQEVKLRFELRKK